MQDPERCRFGRRRGRALLQAEAQPVLVIPTPADKSPVGVVPGESDSGGAHGQPIPEHTPAERQGSDQGADAERYQADADVGTNDVTEGDGRSVPEGRGDCCRKFLRLGASEEQGTRERADV